jgi:Flp pilus assembly protein TadD
MHSAFWLEHRIWGDELLGYHLVNIALHASSAFLLALILRELAVPGAIAAACLFALHPVQVESVAWISELKNTLSTVFYLASALVYLRFADTRRRDAYGVAFLLYVLALLTKSVTATLPASLLIVAWWQRGRLEWRRDAEPLIPFFAIGIAAGLFTAWFERNLLGAQGAGFELTAIERVLLAGRVVWFYLGKLFWPSELMFIYPRWRISQAEWAQYLHPLGVALALLALWSMRRRSRAPLATLLLFGVALAPALGFVNVFPFRFSFVADHFQYLATIPVIAFVCAAGATLPVPGLILLLLVGIPLAVLANRHAREFASAETLYRATLASNPDAWIAHNNLATLLMAHGQVREAREQYMEALRLDPNVVETQVNVGRVLIEERALPEAIEHLREAVRLDPRHPEAHANLGVALLRQGQLAEAIAEFEQTLRLAPAHALARTNLAVAHQKLGIGEAKAGRFDQAIAHFESAAQFAPDDATIRYNLGTAYLAAGRPRDASAQLREALRLDPNLAQARANLAIADESAGR